MGAGSSRHRPPADTEPVRTESSVTAVSLAGARVGIGRLMRVGMAALSAGAAAIHFAVVEEHFEEYLLFGVFFVAAGALQALWAFLILARPSKGVYFTGLVGNAGIVVLWVVSRTTGLPIGPEPGSPEAASILDLVATSYEALIAVGLLVLLTRGPLRRRLPPWVGAVTPWLLAAFVALVTTLSLVSWRLAPAHGQEHSGGVVQSTNHEASSNGEHAEPAG